MAETGTVRWRKTDRRAGGAGRVCRTHCMVRRLGAEAFEIRQLPDLERPMDGLILPGGESTAMRKLLDELGLYEPLRAKIAAGLPVYGTCAGLLLLAKEIEGGTPCFATMDVSAVRNATGVSLEVFTRRLNLPVWGRFR